MATEGTMLQIREKTRITGVDKRVGIGKRKTDDI